MAQDLRSMTAGSRLSVRSRITAWPSAAVRDAQEKSGVGEMRVLAHAIDVEVGVVSCVFFVCDYIFFSCPILELVVNEVLSSILGLELVYFDENRRAFF